jgi:hypothetical protein
MGVNARPHRACGVLLLEQQRRRHHDVGVHSPERQPQAGGHPPAPTLELPQRAFVADHEGGVHLVQERLQTMVRIPPQHEPCTPARQAAGDVGYAFYQELVMTQVGAFDERNQT